MGEAETGARKIIIVSDPFHTRRVRWLFRNELATTGAQILTGVAAPLKYTASNWWQTEQGLINSKTKLSIDGYYRVGNEGVAQRRDRKDFGKQKTKSRKLRF